MKILFTILGSLLASSAMAQTIFQLNVSSEQYYGAPAPYYISTPGWDNDPIEYQQLGFEFTYQGIKYSEFHISPNGYIYFGNDPFERVIDIFGCDLYDNPNDNDTAFIVSQTLGSPGNRVKIIEWRNARFKTGAESDVATFQIRLLEKGGNVQFVYGNIVASEGAFGESTGSFCGIWDDVAKTYLFLHGNTVSPSMQRTFSLPFPTLDGVPADGTSYLFTSVVNSVNAVSVLPLNIYPNPSNGNVHIQLENETIHSLNVYTINGEALNIAYTQNGSDITLASEALPSGMYMVRIQDEEATRVARLIIKK